MTRPRPLTERTLRRAAAILAAQDPDLGGLHTRFGPPPLWGREPGFETLVRIVLEQQVSLASADAAFARLTRHVRPLEPARVARTRPTTFARAGITRQKTGYIRALAAAIVDDDVDLDALPGRDDDDVRAELVRLKGIGRWSADVYLLMALRRPDVWPVGDLALQTAARRVKRLRTRPDDHRLSRLAERWRPWRAVAARMLWHGYLSDPAIRSR